MQFGKSSWKSFEQGIDKEWLLTNGIGGFACSTIIGANTRRYHGLLVASLKPPVSRHLLLSKIDETITIGDKSYDLYSYQTPGHTMRGYLHLQRVEINPLPVFLYSIENVFVEKKICMVYGKNTVIVVYHIINGDKKVRLRLTPLVNFRDYHFNSSSEHLKFHKEIKSKAVMLKPACYELDLNISCSEGDFTPEDNFFYNMDYVAERERGLQSTEDHYIPGYFDVDIKPFEDKFITIAATIEKDHPDLDGLEVIRKEESRLKKLLEKAGYGDDLARRLVLAADDFIVHRESTGAKTIIAGYPWFTDWGRDTMIALPGITLTTRRFEDAREILYTFSRYIKDGLIPNMFPDVGTEPPYNTVDAALWYFEAVNKYLEYTGDFRFIEENIYSALKEIISSYMSGTKFKIKMDEDYLITAGDKNTQLTWMDSKIGEWAVTPRHGKAVEINALWYNALIVMSMLSEKFNDPGSIYEAAASKVRVSFEQSFWNSSKQCLYDVISSEYKDDRVRPNQILAVSLSNPVITGDKAKLVVERVWEELYTSYGLRSLSPREKEYAGIYIGDQFKRDSAYHQGTVWTWPLGHFITAYTKAFSDTEQSRSIAQKFIEPFIDHLRDACVGSISEIFDGDEPLIPRGCFAQAWSVGEILRAYVEDVLKHK